MFTFPESSITNPNIDKSDFHFNSGELSERVSLKGHHHAFFQKLYRNKKLQERYNSSNIPVNFIVCPRRNNNITNNQFMVEEYYLDYSRKDHINYFVHSNAGHIFTPWIAYHRLFHLITIQEIENLDFNLSHEIERFIYGEIGVNFMRIFNANLEQSKVKTIRKIDNTSELLYRNGIKITDKFDIDTVNVIDRMTCKSARTGILYTRPMDDLFPELYASYIIKGRIDFKKFENNKIVRSYKNNFGVYEFHEIEIDVDLANEMLDIARIQLQDDFDNINKRYIGKSVAF